MSNVSENSRQHSAKHDAIPMLEWVISCVGFVLVIASLVFLLHKAIFVERKPPDMQARLLSSRKSSQGYVATIELKNTGGQTAAELMIVARLAGEQVDSERQAIVDYLPPKSTRQVNMFFAEQPTPANLRVEFISFNVP